MKKNIVIIGSGFGGLSSAALLAHKGHNVLVLEKNQKLGGRAMTFSQKGFTFDMGPSWYLMPGIFKDYFKLLHADIEDYVQLEALDPMYRMFFSPTDRIDIVRDIQKNLDTFEAIEKGASSRIRDYLKQAELQYNLAVDHFLYKNFESIWDFFTPEIMLVGKNAHIFTSLERHIKSYTKSDKLQKILGYAMVFLGGAPHNTPALYSLMSHVDYNLGVFYPQGGFGALADAFIKLGKEKGVTYRTSAPVSHIRASNGRVEGVEIGSEFIPADIVISNADYHHTETVLLDKKDSSYSQSYWNRRTMAPSAYIIHLGLNKKVPNLLHHNLILTHDWHAHFKNIFETPSWPEKPSYYVCCASKSDPSVAPKGGETLFVLVPVASGLEDSDEVRQRYYEHIMTDLEKHIGTSVRENIVVERIYTHRDFQADFNAFKGTALGMAHTLLQTAHNRPSMRSKKVQGLFYTGQYTQPGIGVPICVISGQLVSNLIET